MKTREQKAQYCREWRIKNRERYLSKKRENYQNNRDNYREESRGRSSRYYYEVVLPKRKANPEQYKILDKAHSQVQHAKRKATMRKLRTEAGGRCTDCGYYKYLDILQFHHHNGGKENDVASTQSVKKMIIEAKKCILLCPNCHAIRHLKP